MLPPPPPPVSIILICFTRLNTNCRNKTDAAMEGGSGGGRRERGGKMVGLLGKTKSSGDTRLELRLRGRDGVIRRRWHTLAGPCCAWNTAHAEELAALLSALQRSPSYWPPARRRPYGQLWIWCLFCQRPEMFLTHGEPSRLTCSCLLEDRLTSVWVSPD